MAGLPGKLIGKGAKAAPPPPRVVEVPYRVACACGNFLMGARRDSFQIVRCPNCAADRFILPRSPLPPLDTPATVSKDATPRAHGVWTYPLLAGLLTLLLVAGLFVAYRIFLVKDKGENHEDPPPGKTDSLGRLKAARANLALGKFRLAAQALEREDGGGDLPASDRRRWAQAYREAALLADLAGEPLEDILHHAMSMPAAEWQADFPHRFQGKAILFDVQLSRTADGRLQANYQLFAGGDPARLDVSNLALFRTWEVNEPRRVIFAARLASVALEPPGPVWVVRFLPESAALMTSREAVGHCCPPLAEAESARVLEQQAELVLRSP